jgi:hypothetical protein
MRLVHVSFAGLQKNKSKDDKMARQRLDREYFTAGSLFKLPLLLTFGLQPNNVRLDWIVRNILESDCCTFVPAAQTADLSTG